MKILLLFFLTISVVFAEKFSYDENDEFGPSNWFKVDEQCGGRNQSPIDIETNKVVLKKQSPLKINYFKKKISSIKLTNDGDVLVIKLDIPDSSKSFEFNGETYVFDNVHFHWGNAKSRKGGSEHTVNGHRFAAEAHFVHFNRKYGSVANALGYSDGLAVIGMLMKLTDSEYTQDQVDYLKYVEKVTPANSTYTINFPKRQHRLSIDDFLPSEINKFYYYRGSLTTPPCTPVVQWILSTDLIQMYPVELRTLNKLEKFDGMPILKNFRPVQRLGSRKVYKNA